MFIFLCTKITCQNTQGHVEPGDDINFVIDKLYSILSIYVLTFSFLLYYVRFVKVTLEGFSVKSQSLINDKPVLTGIPFLFVYLT